MKFLHRALLTALIVIPQLCFAGHDARVRELVTLREKNVVGGVEFSADGLQLISMPAAYSGEAHVWAWRERTRVASLQGAAAHLGVTTPSRSSADGKFWAQCGSPVVVWDARLWQTIATLPGACEDIGFTADSETMVVIQHALVMDENSPSIVAYDTRTWRRRWSLRTAPFYPKSLALSPDGRHIAIGGHVSNVRSTTIEGKIPTFGEPPFPDTGLFIIVDVRTQAISRMIPVPEASYTSSQSVAWSQNGKSVTYGANAALRTYDAFTGAPQQVLEAEGLYAKPKLFVSPNGKYSIETEFGERHDYVRIVDVSGSTRKVLHQIRARPMHVAWSSDSRHFALSGAPVSLGSFSPFLELLVPSSGKIIVYEVQDAD